MKHDSDAHAAFDDLLAELSPAVRTMFYDRLTALIDASISVERERCVALCRKRVELWRTTTAARSPIASAREETRARANEAAYLADLLASGEPGAERADV